MKSRLADAARRSLQEDVKRMTAEQRLAAFLAHCELMAQLTGAGSTGHRTPRKSRIAECALVRPANRRC